MVSVLLGAIAVLALLNWHLYSTPIDISPLAPAARSADSKDGKEVAREKFTWRYDPATQRYETDAQQRARIRADLQRSRQQIAANLGRPPRAVVWPYGRYTEVQLAEAVFAEGGDEDLGGAESRKCQRQPSWGRLRRIGNGHDQS